MIKEMNGWKVVCINNTGEWQSFSRVVIPYTIKYSKYVRVYPTLKDSMLFFFPQKEDAASFLSWHSYNRIILPCIAYDCQKIKYRSFNTSDDISNFWKARKNKKSTRKFSITVPDGSWVAKSIMIIE